VKADGALCKQNKGHRASIRSCITNFRFGAKRLKSQCFNLIGGFLSAIGLLYHDGFILQRKYVIISSFRAYAENKKNTGFNTFGGIEEMTFPWLSSC